jgi:hypothetical protein
VKRNSITRLKKFLNIAWRGVYIFSPYVALEILMSQIRRIPEWKVPEYGMGSWRKRVDFLEAAVSQKVSQHSDTFAGFDRRATV